MTSIFVDAWLSASISTSGWWCKGKNLNFLFSPDTGSVICTVILSSYFFYSFYVAQNCCDWIQSA